MVRIAIFDHQFDGPIYQLIKAFSPNVITRDVTARNKTMLIGDSVEIHFHTYGEDLENVAGQMFNFILCHDFVYSAQDKWADFLRTRTPSLRLFEI